MNFGSYRDQGAGRHAWTVKDDDEAFEILKTAWDVGINFFDTADVHATGDSERVTGTLLKTFGVDRKDYVLASKWEFLRPPKLMIVDSAESTSWSRLMPPFNISTPTILICSSFMGSIPGLLRKKS